MIAIDPEECNLCGVCVERCVQNFEKTESSIEIMATNESCLICGHCVSLCPTNALVHHDMDMSNFTQLDKKAKFDADEFDTFVRSRRSVRSFKKRQVSQEVLARLVDLARYAPTGSNKQDVEILVLQDKERLARIAEITTECITEIYPKWQNADPETIARRKPDPIFHQAPTVMIFHQPKASGKTDSVIAAQTIVMSAITHGLGSCYIGFLEYAWHNREEVRELVNLPEGHSIGSVLILGYPRLKYLRAVDRQPMSVRWE